jgi:Flp pilus assembly protein TadG
MTGAVLRLARRFRADSKGVAALEFAIVSTAFIAFIMGICYISIMYFNRQSLDWAVQLAARQAEINSSATPGQIRKTINDYLNSVNLPNATVTYSVATVSGIKTASIAASFNQTYSVPFVHTFNITFTSTEAVPQS